MTFKFSLVRQQLFLVVQATLEANILRYVRLSSLEREILMSYWTILSVS